jgi:hypothetical protein
MKLDLVNKLFSFVISTSRLFNIDESHSLRHSIDVFTYSNKIYNSELKNDKTLINHKKIIDISSILHDMCDKKYMNEDDGIKRIEDYIKNDVNDKEMNSIKNIIKTMSYSKVKKNGFPILNDCNLPYHIVREADLLTSYDFERSIVYQMMRNNDNYKDSINDSLNLFNKRMLNYRNEKLFLTNYSIKESKKLEINSLKTIKFYKNIYK